MTTIRDAIVSPSVLADRLAQLNALSLAKGAHDNFESGLCAMEAAAWIAGEPWSDDPTCVDVAISAFMRGWNDGLPSDADRDRLLKPIIARTIGTRGSDALAKRRGYLALDWLIRVHTPRWLDLVPALHSHATALRNLEEIVDLAGATAAGTLTKAARAAARAAAWDAARDAAGDAARAAAGAAAGDAAWEAAGAAAWDAAGAAAWAAAWDAATDAARAAAWDFLKPTVEWLQVSATDLIYRMIDLQEAA
ncbi:MAG: hypothetical protein ACRESS_12380 [Stenotrophobium sp.]